VRALYSFVPSTPGEISFDKGAIIEVSQYSDSDWWYGLQIIY
jgi:hypothetical protein